MAVNFKIISYHRLSPEQVTEFTVESSAVFGRSAKADWCLPDPEKVVSGTHVRIEKEGDDFYLYDISTNGVFVNRSVEPVGDSGSHKLSNDDLLSIGDYEITVDLVAKDSGVDVKDEHETLLDQAIPATPHIDIDPMEFLAEDLIPSEKSEPAPSVSSDLNDSFIVPESQSSVAIPEEWDFSLLTEDEGQEELTDIPETESLDIAELSEPVVAELDVSEPEAVDIEVAEIKAKPTVIPDDVELSLPEAPEAASIIPEEIELPVSEPEQAIAPEPIPQPVAIPEPVKVRPSVKKTAVKPAPQVAQPVPNSSEVVIPITAPKQSTKPPQPRMNNEPVVTASSGAELDMFFKGLGLSANLRKESISAQTYFELGQSMNLMFMGLIKLLRNRALLKSEFKINQTTFQQTENNPLKFSATIDDVFNNLYLHGSSSFLSSDKAIKEAFSDTEKHDKAISAGTLGALMGVLDQLSPEKIKENNIQEHYFDKLISSNKHARNWDLFIQLHDDLKNEISTHGSGALTDEFVKAYDEKIKSL